MSKFRYDDEQNKDSLSIASILGEYWANEEAADAAQAARSGPSGYEAPERESDEDGVKIYRPRQAQPRPEARGKYASLWANDWASRPVPKDAVDPSWEQPVIAPPPPPAPGMSVREILSDYWENQSSQGGYGIDLDEPAESAPAMETPPEPEAVEASLPEPEPETEPEPEILPEVEVTPEPEEAYSVSRILEEYWESLGGRKKDAAEAPPLSPEEVPDGGKETAPPDYAEYDLPHVLFGAEDTEEDAPEERETARMTPEEAETEAAAEDSEAKEVRPEETAGESEEEDEAGPTIVAEPLPEYTEEEAQEHLRSAMRALGIDPDAEPEPDEDEDVRVWGAAPPAQRGEQVRNADEDEEDEEIRVWGLEPEDAVETDEPVEDRDERDEDMRVWGLDTAEEASAEPEALPDAEPGEPEEEPLPEPESEPVAEPEEAEPLTADVPPESEAEEKPEAADEEAAPEEELEDTEPEDTETEVPEEPVDEPEVVWDAETEAAFAAMLKIWDDLDAANSADEARAEARAAENAPEAEPENQPEESESVPEAEPEAEYELPTYSVQDILAEFWAEQGRDEIDLSDRELPETEALPEQDAPSAEEAAAAEEPEADDEAVGTAEETADGQPAEAVEEEKQAEPAKDWTALPKSLWGRVRGLFGRRQPEEAGDSEATSEDGFELEDSLFSPETLELDPEYFEDEREETEDRAGDTAVFEPGPDAEREDADEQGKAVDMLTTEEAAIRGDEDVPEPEIEEEPREEAAASDNAPEPEVEEEAEGWSPEALLTGSDEWERELPEPEREAEIEVPEAEPMTETELKDRLGLLYAMMSGGDTDDGPLFDRREAEEEAAPDTDEPVDYFGQAMEEARSQRQEQEAERQEPTHFQFEEGYLAAAEANAAPEEPEEAPEDEEEPTAELPEEEAFSYAAEAESPALSGRSYSVDDILAQFKAGIAGEDFGAEVPADAPYIEETITVPEEPLSAEPETAEAEADWTHRRPAPAVQYGGVAAAAAGAGVVGAAAGSAALGTAGAAAGTVASMAEEARRIAAMIGTADESGLAAEQGHQPFSFGGGDGEEAKSEDAFDPRFRVGSSRSGMYFGDKELDLSADADYEPPQQSTDDLYHWSKVDEEAPPEKEDNSILGRLRKLMRPQPRKRSLNAPPEYSAEEYFAAAAAEEEKRNVEAALKAAQLAAEEGEGTAPATELPPVETEAEEPESEAPAMDFNSLFGTAAPAETAESRFGTAAPTETAEDLFGTADEPAPEPAEAPTPEEPDSRQFTDLDAQKADYAPEKDYEPPEEARRATGVELDDENAFPSFWQFIQGMAVGLVARVFGAGVRTAPDTVEDEDEDLGPEQTPAAATRYYGSFVQSLRLRSRLGIALLVVLAYITLGLPVTGMLKTYQVAAAFCLGLQLAIMLLNLDVITNAAVNLAQGRFGADSLATLCCILTSLDALAVALDGFGTPHTPLCLISSLSLMGVLYASVLSTRGLRKALRVPAIGKRSYTVCGEQDLKGKDVTLLKSSRPATGFVRRSEETPPDENAFYRVAPLLSIFCLLLTVIVVLVKKSSGDFLYVLTALLCPAVPVTALLCFALPYFVGTMRIFSSGAAVAGWSGLCDIGRSQNLIVTDRDLFPEGSVEIDTIRIFADVSAEKIISYAGSMICASGSGIGSCFADLMQKNACTMKRVENFEFLPGGGFKGIIDGETVLCGGTELMRLMNVRIPYRLVSKTTVLLAVDGILYGIFNLKYEALPPVRKALVGLIRSNRHPIFAIRDFNVGPEMLHESFDVATDGYDFPPYVERFALSEAKPGQNSKVAAVVCREGLGPLVHMADTGRSMYVATRINLLLTVLAAVLGVLLVFGKLLSAGTVSAGFLLLFMLVAALPVVALSLILRF